LSQLGQKIADIDRRVTNLEGDLIDDEATLEIFLDGSAGFKVSTSGSIDTTPPGGATSRAVVGESQVGFCEVAAQLALVDSQTEWTAGTLAGAVALSDGTVQLDWKEIFRADFATWNPGDWIKHTGTGAPSVVADPTATDGNAINSGGYVWYSHATNIPFDPTALYRVRVKTRQVTAAPSGTNNTYVGVNGVKSDGVTLINAVGQDGQFSSQHYLAMTARNLPVGGAFQEFIGYFRDLGTTNVATSERPSQSSPGRLYSGTAFFRPMFIMGYTGGGNAYLDYLVVEKYQSGTITTAELDLGAGPFDRPVLLFPALETGSPGTAKVLRYRQKALSGDPWGAWIPVVAFPTGEALTTGIPLRFVQVEIELATTDTTQTPALRSFGIYD
jgi:hypothetical protein